MSVTSIRFMHVARDTRMVKIAQSCGLPDVCEGTVHLSKCGTRACACVCKSICR